MLGLVTGSAFGEQGSKTNSKIRGIRLDPGYLYSHKEDEATLIRNIKQWGFNTVFLYVYSAKYGAFYPLKSTEVPDALVEQGLGKTDFLAKFTKIAKKEKIQVYAIFPLNQFDSVWDKYPEWRAKKSDQKDYTPVVDQKFLSVFSEEFRSWHAKLIGSFLKQFPDVYGVEVVEPSLDLHWKGDTDFHPEALAAYKKECKKSVEDTLDECARTVRAKGLTDFIAASSAQVHAEKRKFAVVQTWPATAEGKLMDAGAVAQATGFDFYGISKLAVPSNIDLLSVELIWQQWKNEFRGRSPASASATPTFVPSWTFHAAKEVIAQLGSEIPISVHVEFSSFGAEKPTFAETRALLRDLEKSEYHSDVYDYAQMSEAIRQSK